MDQRWAAEVRLARHLHYNHLEISSKTLFFFSEFKYYDICFSQVKQTYICALEHEQI